MAAYDFTSICRTGVLKLEGRGKSAASALEAFWENLLALKLYEAACKKTTDEGVIMMLHVIKHPNVVTFRKQRDVMLEKKLATKREMWVLINNSNEVPFNEDDVLEKLEDAKAVVKVIRDSAKKQGMGLCAGLMVGLLGGLLGLITVGVLLWALE